MTNQELEIKLDKLVRRLDNIEGDFLAYERAYKVYLKRRNFINSLVDRIYCYFKNTKYNPRVTKQRQITKVNKKLDRLFKEG